MKKNKLVIACAGSGKTTQVVKESGSIDAKKKILITTFTDNNVATIKDYFIQTYKCLLPNITIKPWYSFELNDLIKPFLPRFISNIRGINMNYVNLYGVSKNNPNYYIDANERIYKDRIANLAFLSMAINTNVLTRLQRLYDYIFIDEVQDLSGYDYDVIKQIAASNIIIQLYGDPRQRTFETSAGSKNKKCESIVDFIKDEKLESFEIDLDTLNVSHRCSESIMEFSSRIFSNYIPSKGNTTGGKIYLVSQQKCNLFLNYHPNCMILRPSKNKVYSLPFLKKHITMNIGLSKGSSYHSVLLLLTKDEKRAILDDNLDIIEKRKTKADLYVALTRTEGDVGIVVDEKDIESSKSLSKSISIF